MRASTSSTIGAGATVHGMAALILIGLSLAAALLTGGLLIMADQPGAATGDLVVVFPAGTSETSALTATAESDGVVRRRAALGPIWYVSSDVPGFADRLRRNGATLVLPGLPFPSLSIGGCSYLPFGSYDRPATAKLRAGPM